jgi:hypothetical protein
MDIEKANSRTGQEELIAFSMLQLGLFGCFAFDYEKGFEYIC